MNETIDPIAAASALVRAAAVRAFGDEVADVDPAVRRSDRADLQADLALGLGRRLKKAPPIIARAIADAIPTGDPIAKVEVAGPGFINLTLASEWLARAASTALADVRLGVPVAAAPERVVIDYSSPNVAKEMHVGHLPSTVIGDALARLLEWRGHTVVRQNHLGDWGTPFGMLIEHLVDLGGLGTNEASVAELGSFYRAARMKFDEDAAFADRSRRRVVLLQSGDTDTLAMWRALVDVSKRYFEDIYAKLGVTLTPADIAPESLYNERLGPLAAELETIGKATVNDGALCVFPAGFTNKEGDPLPLIVKKKDGGFGYATTDLAAIRYRLHELHATRILYVVGSPQHQHLTMVFRAATELGWLRPPARAEHVNFGTILGPDKKAFASRAGEAVRLADLIREATARAGAVIDEKLPDLDPAGRAELAPQIGVGAIKYALLSTDRVKDSIFDLDRMVTFEGNSAGYMQYAHARIQSIFRKAEGFGDVVRPSDDDAERALVLELLGFGAAVVKVETSLEPHHLSGYLYGLATRLSTFYDKCPVLRADPPLRASRLALLALTAKTLARGLLLLGIDAPNRM